jgi:FHS family L-fucose permease-like MFS transporter
MKYIRPQHLLASFSVVNILLLLVAVFTTGSTAVTAVLLTPFFMSIMFPTIFALGLEGLGHETEFASSFIVMAICGAAVVPPLMTFFASFTGALHWSLFILAACYAVVVSFGLFAPRLKTA